MPKEGVQITLRKNTITWNVNNPELQEFLMPLAYGSMGVAVIRKYCAFTTQDWLCYMACLEYEPLKNRDEDDRGEEHSTNMGRHWGTPEESRILDEQLFADIKDDYPLAKKITYELYCWQRFRDHGSVSHLQQLQFLKQAAQ